MLDEAFRDQANPRLAPEEFFQRGPIGQESLLAIRFFLFSDFLELGIDLWQFDFVQAQLGTEASVNKFGQPVVAVDSSDFSCNLLFIGSLGQFKETVVPATQCEIGINRSSQLLAAIPIAQPP